jgi:hypothetical protein
MKGLYKLLSVVKDGKWRTIKQLSDATGNIPTAASANMRNLRKAKYGGYIIERRHLGNGLYEYRMALDEDGNPLTSKEV